MRFYLFLVGTLVLRGVSAQDALRSETIRTFALGDSSVNLVVHRSPERGLLYYNMHDDESTSVDAAKKIVEEYGGTLYELTHTGRRYLGFNYDSMYYAIDPNRIYTDAGVWRELRRALVQDSLRRENMLQVEDSLSLAGMRDSLILAGDSLLYSALAMIQQQGVPVVIDHGMLTLRLPLPTLHFNARDTFVFGLVRAFADSLLAIMQIDKQNLVIALHNNSNNGYSLSSYLVDNIYEGEAHATYKGMHPDPDEFYFVTERRLFEALQPNTYHIVLQDNHGMTDDGSLSVYCGKRGIHYVNVEAQHKHEKEQIEMLEIMLERLHLNGR